MYVFIYTHVRLILMFFFQTKLGNVAFDPSGSSGRNFSFSTEKEMKERRKGTIGETEKFFSNISNC